MSISNLTYGGELNQSECLDMGHRGTQWGVEGSQEKSGFYVN